MKKEGKILIIQGAQYGSEGKGQIAALIAEKEANMAVRTGSINAGHTVWFDHHLVGWTTYSMQQIPTAWVVPNIPLVIGAGAFIHPEILERECAWITEATGEDVKKRLFIDYRCTLHTKASEAKAAEADRHHKMGATGKGSSEALKLKLDARGDFDLARSLSFAREYANKGFQIVDTAEMMNDAYDLGHTILLEGTQGSLLDLNLAEHPFVTNRGCNSATWLAEAGLSPCLNVETVFVARTFPIRVAGNSGFMGEEISWETLWEEWNDITGENLVPQAFIDEYRDLKDSIFEQALRSLGHGILEFWDTVESATVFRPERWTNDQKEKYSALLADIPSQAFRMLESTRPEIFALLRKYIETTTVTKKPRRLARFSHSEFSKALTWNRPNRVFLGFANYLDPSLWNATNPEKVFKSEHFTSFVKTLETKHNIKICGTSTGAQPKHHFFF